MSAAATGRFAGPSIVSIVAGLESQDVLGLDRDAVRAALELLSRVKGWHDGLHVRLSRRLPDLAASSPATFPQADIAKAAKSSQREANQAARRVGTLDAVPAMEDALGSGDVSAEHIDSLGRAMKRLKPEQRDQLAEDGPRLLAIAKSTTPEEFDKVLSREVARLDRDEGGHRLTRQRRAARFRSWTDRDTGMICLRGELDPDTGLKVISRIDAVTDALFHGGVPDDCPDGDGKQDWLRAQAFTGSCSAGVARQHCRTAVFRPTATRSPTALRTNPRLISRLTSDPTSTRTSPPTSTRSTIVAR